MLRPTLGGEATSRGSEMASRGGELPSEGDMRILRAVLQATCDGHVGAATAEALLVRLWSTTTTEWLTSLFGPEQPPTPRSSPAAIAGMVEVHARMRATLNMGEYDVLLACLREMRDGALSLDRAEALVAELIDPYPELLADFLRACDDNE